MISDTGTGDMFVSWDVDEVGERVVLPVVCSVLQPRELEGVEVGCGPRF